MTSNKYLKIHLIAYLHSKHSPMMINNFAKLVPVKIHYYHIFVTIVLFSWSCTPSAEEKPLHHPLNIAAKTLEIEKTTPVLEANRYNVAFLIMDGVFNTELTAPFDIFQHTIFRDSIKPMNVFLVANTHQPVTSFEGIRLLPDYNYLTDSLPFIDILVIPSAEHHLDTDLEDEKMLNFVREVDKNASFVTSHCDGAFVLAKAGLLDHSESTTFPSDIEAFRKMFPQLTVHENVLFVHDGKYITSAGGAKSFEASLYLCEYLYNKQVAKRLAKGLVIDWNLEAVPHIIVK